MRAFIAIPIPNEIQEMGNDITGKLRSTGADVKWVDSRNYHLTLKFLGDINKKKIPNIYNHLTAVANNTSKLTLNTNKLGFFPNEKRPRVLWLGIEGEIEKTNYLAEQIDLCLSSEGFAVDGNRKFHLTLGRIKTNNRQEELLEVVREINKLIGKISFNVNAFAFMESKLTSQGALYTSHKIFALK